ncbi:hypothetical protein PTSG_02590 [Salpingoeca rosetta]|uniref:Bestrophin homolog n=1 Tax=Salpingoeca rosetta (strain ATCC 50818 / BSB-021) TaxID=946362 RepID=F2U2R1_SALR5|nr:uncharacterized protein PTSG_02590 [Salpingoeca rosetta]EGD81905.1 hypothetical protein PTSG_02590 [Salpingoeca rosetta]|eukprot:XP_004996088.1 hypothetical protein PTSG_02590 [Salpingoeca rosetta]
MYAPPAAHCRDVMPVRSRDRFQRSLFLPPLSPLSPVIPLVHSRHATLARIHAAVFMSTIYNLRFELLTLILYNILVYFLLKYDIISTKPEGDFLSMLGVSLTFFQTFGNNQAYSRWWEARMLWGGIVNLSRTVPTYLEGVEDPGKKLTREQKLDIVQRHIAYIRLVVHQLRREQVPGTAGRYLQNDEMQLMHLPNPAVGLLSVQSRAINKLYRDGLIDSYARIHLLRLTGTCLDLQGACERIKTTPFPPTYFLFLRFVLACFLLILPFQMFNSYGYPGAVASILIGTAYLAMERFGSDLADPFEGRQNDCAMLAICDTIQKDLLGPDIPLEKHRLSSAICIM